MTLEASAIPSNTPLLVSRPAMSKLGIIIDRKCNKIHIEAIGGVEGQWRDVPTALSGDLLLPIDDVFAMDKDEALLEEGMATTEIISPVWWNRNATEDALRKLHIQF